MRTVLRLVQAASIEVFIALLCIVSGLPILINPVMFAPAVLMAILPVAVVLVWGAVLFLGGLLTLAGIMSGSIHIERAGLILIAAGAFVFATMIWMMTGWSRLFLVGTYYIFSWALGTRYIELGKVLKVRRLRWKTRITEREE